VIIVKLIIQIQNQLLKKKDIFIKLINKNKIKFKNLMMSLEDILKLYIKKLIMTYTPEFNINKTWLIRL
jgi:hypothetical protein